MSVVWGAQGSTALGHCQIELTESTLLEHKRYINGGWKATWMKLRVAWCPICRLVNWCWLGDLDMNDPTLCETLPINPLSPRPAVLGFLGCSVRAWGLRWHWNVLVWYHRNGWPEDTRTLRDYPSDQVPQNTCSTQWEEWLQRSWRPSCRRATGSRSWTLRRLPWCGCCFCFSWDPELVTLQPARVCQSGRVVEEDEWPC